MWYFWFNLIRIKQIKFGVKFGPNHVNAPGPQGRMRMSEPGTKSVKRRMFSNTSRLVTSLVSRALPSLHAVQIPRWKRLRNEMSSRVDYDVDKVAVRLKLGYLRRKRMPWLGATPAYSRVCLSHFCLDIFTGISFTLTLNNPLQTLNTPE